jgi:hypothetical protein
VEIVNPGTHIGGLDKALSVALYAASEAQGVLLSVRELQRPLEPGEFDIRSVLAPLFDSPRALTPESEREWKRLGGRRSTRHSALLRPWIAARRARTLDALPLTRKAMASLRAPLLLRNPPAGFPLDPAFRVRDFELRWSEDSVAASTLVGSFVPPGATDVVVVGAHYDSHGSLGGTLYAGADDNGSGVAAVLEAIQHLRTDFGAAASRRGLVVCFFDAEEWGLQGSRAFVESFRESLRVSSMVNVDAVGRVRDDQVYVLGLSKEPALAAKAVEALATQGLKPGPDIDRFGYEHGSDHWPFHRAGIPAITLWASDYAVMDTVDDTPEKVDPVGVARVSKALRSLLLRLLRE